MIHVDLVERLTNDTLYSSLKNKSVLYNNSKTELAKYRQNEDLIECLTNDTFNKFYTNTNLQNKHYEIGKVQKRIHVDLVERFTNDTLYWCLKKHLKSKRRLGNRICNKTTK